jgi:F-type H+-transporting ATPase subunit b
MPQLSQLPDVFLSQLLWLAIGLGFIFFVIARGMVPKIQATVEAREQRIASDLEAARLANEAKQDSARKTEIRVKAAADKVGLKVAAAEGRIRDALAAARTEIQAVAAEAAQDMVVRLSGVKVDAKQAAAAVKAELDV